MNEKENEESMDKPDIVDILLDQENDDPIVLVNRYGRKVSFKKIALIPLEDKLYCLLKPIDKLDNVGDDECIVFYVEEEEGKEPVLMVETDERKARMAYDKYCQLLDEQEGKKS